jgi:prepilin-type N-terminal cleavage/methylation domain-containing protein
MRISSIRPPARQHGTKSADHPGGFSLLEMMMVVTLIPRLRGGQASRE